MLTLSNSKKNFFSEKELHQLADIFVKEMSAFTPKLIHLLK